MPNEAERSLDKRTNGLESAAQVSPKKSGPYDLTKSEAASTLHISFNLTHHKFSLTVYLASLLAI